MDPIKEILDISRENNALLKQILSLLEVNTKRTREVEEILRSQDYSVYTEFLINVAANGITASVMNKLMKNFDKYEIIWVDLIKTLKENSKPTLSEDLGDMNTNMDG